MVLSGIDPERPPIGDEYLGPQAPRAPHRRSRRSRPPRWSPPPRSAAARSAPRRPYRWRRRRTRPGTPARGTGGRPRSRAGRAASSPRPIRVSRAAARATIPAGPANGRKVSNSACTIAASSSGGVRSLSDHEGGQRVDPLGAGGQPAQVGRRDDAAGGEHVQPGEDLPRRTRPQVDQAGQALGDPQGALQDRVGHRSRAYLLQVVPRALQRRAGHRGAQAGLGRDRTAVPAQGAMPQRGVDASARLVEGGRDVGEVEQRRKRVGDRHRTKVAGSGRTKTAGNLGCADQLRSGRIRAAVISSWSTGARSAPQSALPAATLAGPSRRN